ncbi:hypothetical protein OPT61_g1384 [Boeremia exigua]|uniref:Uncharacterized protein n=1 Tax=Boeremia exigua TaxID=749465 RepID=A0ACC2IQP8_9PLEO|nr:hypothetical protein OPT61_g1384 [Boeremia exigua]
MEWKTVVSRKRAIRDAAIQETAELLKVSVDEDSCGFPIPERASIAYLLDQLRTAQLSAEAIVKTIITRAISAHTETNCLSETLFQPALERAIYLDDYFKTHQKLIGPLHGIPISVKDQFHIKGVDTTLGYVGRSFQPSSNTAVMVTILEKLGAVIITKTVIPQSILYGETESPLWGLTTFPGRPELSPGGSSGGEAALMAMCGSICGWGTDIGGSIRVPSHLCGLFGLKPSAGRFSYAGAANSHEGQFHVPSSVGPISPLLSNLVTMTKECLLTEPWMLDPNVVPLPWRQDMFEGVQQRPLRIGLILDDGIVKPHPEVQLAVQLVAALFEEAGHTIVPWSTSEHLDCIKIQDQFYRADGGEDIATEVAVAGEPLIAHVQSLVESSKAISVYQYWQLNRRKTAIQEAYNARWNAASTHTDADGDHSHCVDVLISPVSAHTAVPHRSSRWTGYAKIWNFLDYTAMSFPFANFGGPAVSSVDPGKICIAASEKQRREYTERHVPRNEIDEWVKGLYDPAAMQGLDIGIQIIGRRFQDETVLGVASLLQRLNSVVSQANQVDAWQLRYTTGCTLGAGSAFIFGERLSHNWSINVANVTVTGRADFRTGSFNHSQMFVSKIIRPLHSCSVGPPVSDSAGSQPLGLVSQAAVVILDIKITSWLFFAMIYLDTLFQWHFAVACQALFLLLVSTVIPPFASHLAGFYRAARPMG